MFLEAFKDSVEAEAVNSFWESRKKGKLKKRAEKLGQELLAFFARAKLVERGAVIREATSGIGFVDILATFSSGLLHVVELKMLKGKAVPGPSQLAVYMKQKKRTEGWLVLFDARNANSKTEVEDSIKRSAGTIRTVVIDINPIPPHELP
jgi:RecB family endonuclease NucS